MYIVLVRKQAKREGEGVTKEVGAIHSYVALGVGGSVGRSVCPVSASTT